AGEALKIWAEVGIDVGEMLTCIQKELPEIVAEMGRKRRLGPVQGFVIPTLQRCGLLSERVASHYHDFLKGNLGSGIVGEDVREFLETIPDLPEDTLDWLLSS